MIPIRLGMKELLKASLYKTTKALVETHRKVQVCVITGGKNIQTLPKFSHHIFSKSVLYGFHISFKSATNPKWRATNVCHEKNFYYEQI